MKSLSVLFIIILLGSFSYAQQPVCDFKGKDSLYVSMAGDTINVWDIAVCGYCAQAYSFSVTTSSDTIYIVQTDTAGRIALCACVVDLRASIVGIPSGTYWIVVYRDLLKKYGYHEDTHKFIGSLQLKYEPIKTSPLSWQNFQSGCNPSSVPRENQIVQNQFSLFSNYPNPFNPSTTIQFQISKTEYVVIKVFDVLGREVQTLLSEITYPGTHSLKFEMPKMTSSGIYLCRMIVGSYSQSQIMVFQR